jgi:class 3 adenylate cyclase/CHASE2 domain-containing sensor protein
MKKIRKAIYKTALGLLGGLVAVLFVIGLSNFSNFTKEYFTQFENLMYDLTFKFKLIIDVDLPEGANDTGSVKQDFTLEDRIFIVDIDERSLMRLGAYNTWPRTHHGKVVDFLSNSGASAIMFDVLFKNADFGKRSSLQTMQLLSTLFPPDLVQQHQATIEQYYNYDSVFIESVRQSGNTIACATTAPTIQYAHKTQWQPLSTAQWQQALGMHNFIPYTITDSSEILTWDLMDNIFPELAQAAKYTGLINVMPDADGIHRQIPMVHGWPNPKLAPDATPGLYFPATLLTVAHVFGITPQQIQFKPKEYIDMGKPFGIYRDSIDKQLKTSYPLVTIPMLKRIQQHKEVIHAINTPGAKLKATTIVNTVKVFMSDDEKSAFILNAQDVGPSMLQMILSKEFPQAQSNKQPSSSTSSHNDSTQAIAHSLSNAKDTEMPLANGLFTLGWDEDFEMYELTDNTEEESIYLDSFTVAVLQENKLQIDSMKNGSTLHLSSPIDVYIHSVTGDFRSNIIVFNPDIFDEIIALDWNTVEALQPGEEIRLGKPVRIPLDQKNRMQINYIGNSKIARNMRPFKQVSYYDIIENRLDPGVIPGKIFVLGSTAPSLFDFVSAPHEKEYPGVMIHATVLENILTNNFLKKVDTKYTYIIAILLALLSALLITWLPPFLSIFLLLFIFVAYFLFNYHFFTQGSYLGVAIPQISIIFTFLAVMIIRYFLEEREKKFINSTFKSYISPELIDQMVESGQRPSLGGQEDVLSAYFTDIAAFSTFSEKIGSPSKLVELLNEYLTDMTDILLKHGGTLDKYEGDAIIAFFGAPVSLPNHAQSACETALDMQKQLLVLRKKWITEGNKWPEIVHQMHMRIGINSGPIVTGNMGSRTRMNYTMMGDTVNLAARLESGAKQYGVYSMCSKETLDLTDGTIICRSIDKVKVVGKTLPVQTFELLAHQSDVTPQISKLISLWDQAKTMYEAMQWDDAIALFKQCDALEPYHPDVDPGSKTTPSQVFIERCEQYKLHPPVPANQTWDGVYTATSK